MNCKNTGANKRQKLSLRHGRESIDRTAGQIGAAAILSQRELRRLVAAMID